MNDRDISAGTVVAGALWTASILIWATGWVADIRQLGALSVIFACAAGTAQVRSHLIGQYKRIKNVLIVTSTTGPNRFRQDR